MAGILQKGNNDHLVLGDWNAYCAVCGEKYKASQLKLRWDGQRVCEKDLEQRHMSDLYNYRGGEKPVPWSRPEPADLFTDVTFADNGSTVPSGTFTMELD